MAVPSQFQVAELVHELAVAVQCRGRIAQGEEPQLIRLHAARQAIEQARFQHLLDVHQHLGGRRLRDVHLLGSQAQIARLSQDVEEL
ncbi:hypothetical protein D9M68_672870 [compost metagenome]